MRGAIETAIQHSFLGELASQISGPLLRDQTLHHLNANQEFLDESDGDWVGIVVTGVVHLSLCRPDERRITVRTLTPGGAIGLTSLIDPTIRVSARTLAASSILQLDQGEVRRAIVTQPGVVFAVARDMASSLRDSYAALLNRGRTSVRQRIARHLLEFEAPAAKGEPVVVARSHEEVAEAVSSSREVVTRELAALRRDGVIALHRRRITLLRSDDLARVAAGLRSHPDARALRAL
jgi:CRP-like cAMP-binding protein